MIGKNTYKNAFNKHETRNRLLSKVSANKVIGLAGPDVIEYNHFMRERGFSSIISYEKDINTYNQQRRTASKIKIKYGDINNTKSNGGIFHDLDYCCSVVSLDFDFLNSIESWMLTIAVRPVGLKKTKKILNDNLNSEGYKYIPMKYRDSSPMMSILKIKN